MAVTGPLPPDVHTWRIRVLPPDSGVKAVRRVWVDKFRGRVSGVYTTHLSGAESITIHHRRLQYRRLFPVFLTVVQTDTVNPVK